MVSNGKVALVMGASRGIGRQIAIDLAKDGYHVIVAAKSTSDASSTHSFPPDPNSPDSTISTVAREIHELGLDATAIAVDTRSPTSITALFEQISAQHPAGLDVLVYNPGAIWWASVANTPLKRFLLMQEVNVEGLYASVQASLPLFERRHWQGRIIVVSPPIYSRFFRGKTAYAMGKVAMSVLTKGLAMDWQREGKDQMAITSVWPAVAIESAATKKNQAVDPESNRDLRHPSIFSDAILGMLAAPVEKVNGLLDTDEDFLRRECGVLDFGKYALVPGAMPRRIMPAEFPTLEVAEQADEGRRVDSAAVRSKI